MAIAPIPSRASAAFVRATGRDAVMTGLRASGPIKPATTISKAKLHPDAAADAHSTRHASEIEREIEAQINGSFNYQLIRTVIMGEKISVPVSSAGSEAELAAPGTPSSESSEPNLGVAASSSTTTTAELSVQVNTSTDPSADSGAAAQTQLSNSVIRAESARLTLRIGGARPTPEPVRKDPLVLDLDGNGVHTDAAQTVQFDLDNDGVNEQINGLAQGDAFLAFDQNGNGIIDNGSELFGDQNGAINGYAELAKYDDDGNGQIDASDQIYTQLLLAHLRPEAGVTSSSTRLATAGISAIKLDYQERQIDLGNGDAIAQTGTFTRTDGSTGLSADLLLAMRKING